MTARQVEVAFEPLTALAGGLLGGVLVAIVAWRQLTRDTTTHQGFGARRTTTGA